MPKTHNTINFITEKYFKLQWHHLEPLMCPHNHALRLQLNNHKAQFSLRIYPSLSLRSDSLFDIHLGGGVLPTASSILFFCGFGPQPLITEPKTCSNATLWTVAVTNRMSDRLCRLTVQSTSKLNWIISYVAQLIIKYSFSLGMCSAIFFFFFMANCEKLNFSFFSLFE